MMTVRQEHEENIINESRDVKDDGKRLWLKVIAIAFLVSFIGGSAAVILSYNTLRGTAEDGTDLAQDIKEACEVPSAERPALSQFCPKAEKVVAEAPTIVKSDRVPGPPGRDGRDGTDGTDGRDSNIPGSPGSDGRDSNVPGSPGADGREGQRGLDGSSGRDSTIPGPPGPPGVVAVVDNCEPAPDGQFISDVNAFYDPALMTIFIDCTYTAEKPTGLLP